MRRFSAILVAVLGLWPAPTLAFSGSPGYGDPPGWCTRFSDMWPATVVTNDPTVPTNPERNTFSGFHPDPATTIGTGTSTATFAGFRAMPPVG